MYICGIFQISILKIKRIFFKRAQPLKYYTFKQLILNYFNNYNEICFKKINVITIFFPNRLDK